MVIWLIGLSGAGKTTIGKSVYREWKNREPNTVLVDGDEIREIFSQDNSGSDYSIAGRRKNAERIKQLCAWLDRQGINVVCNILLLFGDVSKWNRENLSGYLEVYVSTPLDVVKARDSKGLYSAAEKGKMKNVVGVDIPFPTPTSPDIIIDNSDSRIRHHDMAVQILSRAREVAA
jgi:adenylylsulfate kinase